jgi:gamma-glutamyl phosphate reductase
MLHGVGTSRHVAKVLYAIADRLISSKDAILAANDMDMAAATSGSLSDVLRARLKITEAKLQDLVGG